MGSRMPTSYRRHIWIVQKDMFLLTTLVVIFFTVFIQGGTIKFLVSKLRIARKSEEGKSMSKDINEITLDHVMSGVQSVTGIHSQHLVMEKIKSFDERFLLEYKLINFNLLKLVY